MLKRINIEEPKEETEKSKIPLCFTGLLHKLKENKKIVIGVSIGIIFLGKASILFTKKPLIMNSTLFWRFSSVRVLMINYDL